MSRIVERYRLGRDAVLAVQREEFCHPLHKTAARYAVVQRYDFRQICSNFVNIEICYRSAAGDVVRFCYEVERLKYCAADADKDLRELIGASFGISFRVSKHIPVFCAMV